ncbi:uncharacterized protein CTRU02_203874 [Colletotrichum truncatum]|uniref:Uncharacterized protein n=1 Tax=Colletotrichum truncatum TaxID=5467 RepID=A0ACC3ZAH5_COLTU
MPAVSAVKARNCRPTSPQGKPSLSISEHPTWATVGMTPAILQIVGAAIQQVVDFIENGYPQCAAGDGISTTEMDVKRS